MGARARTLASALMLTLASTVTSALAPAVPSAAAVTSLTWRCGPMVGNVSASGHYVVRTLSDDAPTGAPTTTDHGSLFPAGTTRTLATGVSELVSLYPGQGWYSREHLATTSGTLHNVRLVHRYDTGQDIFTVDRLTAGWGGFKRLVATPPRADNREYLYGLHDNGGLYRYRVTWVTVEGRQVPRFRSAGYVPGFSALKTITLLSHTPSYDALLATTTTGRLIVVKVGTSSTMATSVVPIRTRSWQVFDSLALRTCHDGTTSLVGVNHTTHLAYAYSMAKLTGTSSAIRGWGQVPGVWPETISASIHPGGMPPSGG